jgi:hypothetical protein
MGQNDPSGEHAEQADQNDLSAPGAAARLPTAGPNKPPIGGMPRSPQQQETEIMTGRPRHDGERYPSGALKRAKAPAPAVTADRTELTLAQAEAARAYERVHEVSQREGRPERRLMAKDNFAAARRALTPQETAVIDLVVLRGHTVAAVATAAGRTHAHMEQLYLAGLNKLADCFERGG